MLRVRLVVCFLLGFFIVLLFGNLGCVIASSPMIFSEMVFNRLFDSCVGGYGIALSHSSRDHGVCFFMLFVTFLSNN